jgi:uncharacterized protein (DUF362 family)
MTCALKNMKGVLSDRSKRLFHTLGLNRPIAALNKVRVADLVIVDSLNGDLDFEEGGNPVETNRMFACRDSVLCDSFGASLVLCDPVSPKSSCTAAELGLPINRRRNGPSNEPE